MRLRSLPEDWSSLTPSPVIDFITVGTTLVRIVKCNIVRGVCGRLLSADLVVTLLMDLPNGRWLVRPPQLSLALAGSFPETTVHAVPFEVMLHWLDL